MTQVYRSTTHKMSLFSYRIVMTDYTVTSCCSKQYYSIMEAVSLTIREIFCEKIIMHHEMQAREIKQLSYQTPPWLHWVHMCKTS